MSGRYRNWSTTLYIRLPASGGDVVVPMLVPMICRKGDVLHASHSDHVLGWVKAKSRRVTWDTACGTRARQVFAGDDPRQLVPWPPYVAPLRDVGLSRCRECHEATGRLRPHVTVQAGGDA